MLTKEELRIGNIVSDMLRKPHVVHELHYNTTTCSCLGIVVSLDYQYVYGIPVTPDWLSKNGFINNFEEQSEDGMKDTELLVFFKDSYSVDIITDIMDKPSYVFSTYKTYVDIDGSLCAKPDFDMEFETLYIHQLQNLIYFLTGKELI